MLLRVTGKGETLGGSGWSEEALFCSVLSGICIEGGQARRGNLLRIQKNDEGPLLPSWGSQSNWGDGRAIPQQGEADGSAALRGKAWRILEAQ